MNSRSNDIALVQKVKDGDTAAFRQLVDKYKDVSLTLACSIIKDKDAAQDVLQDTFIKVYANIHKFKETASFATWLYRIVVNNSLTALRKAKDHSEIETLSIDIGPLATASDEADQLHRTDQEKYIQVALSKLKTEEALVLRLFYLCELSILEISTVTNFSQAKIKVNLHRGRQNMHSELNKIFGKDLKQLL